MWLQPVGYVVVMWFVVRPLGRQLARAVGTGAAIGSVAKARLTSAFEALGPERVARGLTASGHSWTDCFLARATAGGPQAVARVPGAQPRTDRGRILGALRAASPGAVSEVATAWDRNEKAFRELAAEWLEQNHAAAGVGAPEMCTPERLS